MAFGIREADATAVRMDEVAMVVVLVGVRSNYQVH